MTRSFNWKKSLLLGVGFLFVSCCALGTIANRNKPVTSAQEQGIVATVTAQLPTAEVTEEIVAQNTAVPTATPDATMQAVADVQAMPSPTFETAVPLPTSNPADKSETNSQATGVTGTSVPCADGLIQGNPNSKIYHVYGGRYYNTLNDVVCFKTEEDARLAGYRRSKR